MKCSGLMSYLSSVRVLCFVMCSVYWFADKAECTSLMKRIREKQNADDAMRRGLDFESDDWIQVPQPVQDVLMSIDDKLRSLDTFSYTLKLARLDFSLDQLVRRMENIETKLGRLETKFDVRMDKVEEVVISKDIKEEFSNEHLSRGMENLNEKINNKAAYLDAKLDIKLERIMSKLDLLERDLHNSVDDILERLIKNDERHGSLENEMIRKETKFEEFNNNFNNLRLFLKEDLSNLIVKKSDHLSAQIDDMHGSFNATTSKTETIMTELQNSISGTKERVSAIVQDNNNKIDSLSATFNHIDRVRSLTDSCDNARSQTTQEQLDNLTAILQKALYIGEAKFKELDSDVELYTRKVINGIQELWKTSDELKMDLSNTLKQGNKTREMVRQEFRRLHEQIEPLPKLEPKLSHISEDLDKKVVELSATVDNSFATLLVAQNTFIASCRRIQEEEMHIYDILQQIVYEMRNRSITDIHKISTELQIQSSQIKKSVAHVLTAVLMSGNTTSNAMHSVLHQLKQKSKCVIRTDNINWKAIESLCHQISIDSPNPSTTSEKFVNLMRSVDVFEDNNPGSARQSSPVKPKLQMSVDHKNQTLILENKSERSMRNADDNSSTTLGDYELDYQFSDADYSEHSND